MGLYDLPGTTRKEDRDELDKLFEESKSWFDPANTLEKKDVGLKGNLQEFVGQTIWGVAESLSLGTLELSDIAEEAVARPKYEAGKISKEEMESKTDRMEKAFTSLGGVLPESYEGDFGELGTWGQVGYTLGSILGVIPTFLVGGAITSKAITGTAKIGNVGTRLMQKRAGKQIEEHFVKKVVAGEAETIGIKALGKAEYEKIATTGFDAISKKSFANQMKIFGNETFEAVAKGDLSKSIANITGIQEGKMLGGLTDEVFDIITHNKPTHAQDLLFGLGGAILPNSPKVGLVAGAMGYDYLLGLTIGTMRGSASSAVHKHYGYDEPKSYTDKILSDALHEGAILSLLGPVKFIKGGSKSSLIKSTKETMFGILKNLRPAKKMKSSELRTHIAFLDKLTKSEVSKKLSAAHGRDHWNKANWWAASNQGATKTDMQEFVNFARKDFAINAPLLWANEFGAEMLYSLPRMAMGTVAMHSQGIYEVVKDYGIENVELAFGATPEERISNVFTAMFFTRKPHSFHTADRMMAFETDKIRKYATQKGEMLAYSIGGLKSTGVSDVNMLNKFLINYGGKSSDNIIGVNDGSITNSLIENSPEIREIKKIVRTQEKLATESVGLETGTFTEAANRYMLDTFGYKPSENVEQKDAYRENIIKAKAILKFYRDTSLDNKDLSTSTFTPDQANVIVEKLSKMKFGGVELSSINPQKSLASWYRDNLTKATVEPINTIQSFVKGVYSAFGVNFQERDGVIEVPKVNFNMIAGISDKSKASDVQHSFQSAVEQLRLSKKLRLTDEVKSEYEGTTQEGRDKAVELYESTVDNLHTWLYGKDWSRNETDYNIISDDSWYKAYATLLRESQSKNAIAVLTGNGNHNLTTSEVSKLRNEMNDVLSGKIKVKFDESESGVDPTSDEYADVYKFTKKLHSLVRHSNPIAPTNKGFINYESAKRLKVNFEDILGDIVANKGAHAFLKSELTNYSMDQLNLNDLDGSFNIKAGLHSMIIGSVFKTKGQVTHIPTVKRMNAYLESKKLGKEQYNEYKKFYGELVDAVKKSKFPFIQMKEGINETKKGDWFEGLKASRNEAVTHYLAKIRPRAEEFVQKGEEAIDKLDILTQEIQLQHRKLDEIKGAKGKALDEVVADLSQDGYNVREVINQIKAAHQGTNRVLLHQIMSRDKSYSDLLDSIRNSETTDRAFKYARELVLLHAKVNGLAKKEGYRESTLDDKIRQEVEGTHIGDRDVISETIRTSAAQFSLRYGIHVDDIVDVIFKHRSEIAQAQDFQNLYKRLDSEVPYAPDKAKKNLRKIIADIGEGDLSEKDFKKAIVKPLYTIAKMKVDYQKKIGIGAGVHLSKNDILADVHSIISSGTSSIPIPEYRYVAGRFVADQKLMGYTRDRGITGLIDRLGDGTESIVLMSNTNDMSNGKAMRNFPAWVKEEISQSLDSPIKVENRLGLRDVVYKDIIDVNKETTIDRHGIENKFKLLELDENTMALVRVDSKSPIRDSLNKNYTKNGEMLQKIEALGLRKNRIIKNFLKLIDNRTLDDEGILNGVRLTRILLDAPHVFEKASAGFTAGPLDITDQAQLTKFWKYLKLTEPKNGFIGSSGNLERANNMLNFMASESVNKQGVALSGKKGHYKHLYEYVKDWVTPDADGKYPKLKVLSIADEIESFSGGEDVLSNIFNSKARASAWLEQRNPGLTPEEIKYNTDLIGELSKSIVDGEFIMAEKPYVASLAMMASANDKMVKFDNDGNVKWIAAGGIKPSVTHSSVETDTKSNHYGRSRVFYAKTAFKHRPEFQSLLNDLEVDAITFKSANKVNEFKNNRSNDWHNSDIDEHDPSNQGRNTYASIRALSEKSGALLDNIVDWMAVDGNLIFDRGDKNNHISHIPFSSINLFAVGKGHKPMVSANLGIHMRDDNGIREWIGLDNKLKNTNEAFRHSMDNIYYRTALARKLLGHSAEQGDMSFVNTGLDYVMKHDGFITDKWMIDAIDEKVIPYFMNNGGIAGGRVEHGTYDVMSGDFSGYWGTGNDFLNFSIRKKVSYAEDIMGGVFGDERKVLTFFGDFLPSHEFADMQYKPFGTGKDGGKDIGGIVISRHKYSMQGEERTADGYMVKDDSGNKIYITEGVGIDERGHFRDLSYINKKDTIKQNEKDIDTNKAVWEMANELENEIIGKDGIWDQGKKGGMKYGDMLFEVHQWRQDAAIKPYNVALGTINSRQPRNQMGDLIINRLKTFEKDIDGETYIFTSNDQKSGNLSTMNFIDVIHAQDADFDMDKSMVFGASHRKFWAETGRLAGYESTASANLISEKFTSIASGPDYADLFRGSNHKETINNMDAARGRFVKMHQTMTYIANIFKKAEMADASSQKHVGIPRSSVVLRFNDPNQTVKARSTKVVVVNDNNANYVKTAESVTTAVKQFLDMHVDPSNRLLENIDNLQWQIYFGKNGLFEIMNVSEDGEFSRSKHILNDLPVVRDAVVEHFLRPINRYLKMNRGTSPDETGKEVKATLDDFYNTYRSFMFSMNDKFVKWVPRTDEEMPYNISIENGLKQTYAHLGTETSQNSYDYAMRSIYNIKRNRTAQMDESQSYVQNMVTYIQYGFRETGIDTKDKETYINSLLQTAFTDIVKDDAKVIQFEDLASRLGTLEWKIADMVKFDKSGTIKENANYKALVAQKDRVLELKSQIEEVLSYKRNLEDDIKRLKNPVGETEDMKRIGKFTNLRDKPIVVRRKSGDISEVIMPEKRNVKNIYKNDVLLENGKRYEILRGDENNGLEATYNMFGGDWVHTDEGGKTRKLSSGEMNMLRVKLSEVVDQVRQEWNNRADKSKYSLEQYSLKRLSKYIELFEDSAIQGNEAYQEGIVALMLRPTIDTSVIGVSPYRGAVGGGAKFGPKFTENPGSKIIYHILSQIANGRIKKPPITAERAEAILENVTALKKIGFHNMLTGGVNDYKMNVNRSFSHASDFKFGHISKDSDVGMEVFQALSHQRADARKAAKWIIEYASGDRMLSSADLYRASRILTEVAKIPRDQIWVNTVYEPDTGRSHVKERVTTSSLNKGEVRNYGNTGSMEQSVPSVIRNMLKCYK